MAVRKTFEPQIIDGAEINRIVTNEELFDKGSMFAHVRLRKGDKVDWHTHNGEAEYYYILSGTGIYTDSDGSEYEVYENDVCTILPEGGHAIRNDNDDVLEFIALIVYS